MKYVRIALAVVVFLGVGRAHAGSIFLTGHDPDYHAHQGSNAAGARAINQAAINFILDPAYNSFYAGGAHRFLFVESSISPPGGHIDGELGIIDSGYNSVTNYTRADATTLSAQLNLLGTVYSGIVVASDFGGILTSAELNILNARSADIISFLNAGGGLYAMAESNSGAHLTPDGGRFGFLPFVVSSLQNDQNESGFTVTPFGASLGLNNGDINGNASHNIFDGAAGMQIVDMDASGHILSLATRAQVTSSGIVPEPATVTMLTIGVLSLTGYGWRRRKTASA